ncbi:hypothetical protein CYMTET_49397 [Cymbomonas tetramitiformis]|uniref:Uncharacterized protein n=1 Tax=Cymbomonas tetramitiformis TaxID=36881 RepID=A0AAE0BRL4_9CHLO|nr:hypothetical protein CYMTET_49397 [Cymbomonas tetramitiformis]
MDEKIAASLERRDSMNADRDTLSSAQIKKINDEDRGWSFRLEQVDKEIATADKNMEEMIRDVKGIQNDIGDIKSRQETLQDETEPDFKAINNMIATQKVEES